jgi:Toluene-4-monooxygenase system protein B (TmoB)
MTIPLYGFLQGDTIGLLILIEETEFVQTLAHKLQDAASLRVRGNNHFHVVCNEKVVDPLLTVAQAGFQPLDRFDVISGEQE